VDADDQDWRQLGLDAGASIQGVAPRLLFSAKLPKAMGANARKADALNGPPSRHECRHGLVALTLEARLMFAGEGRVDRMPVSFGGLPDLGQGLLDRAFGYGCGIDREVVNEPIPEVTSGWHQDSAVLVEEEGHDPQELRVLRDGADPPERPPAEDLR
jgi:hypothetical protein